MTGSEKPAAQYDVFVAFPALRELGIPFCRVHLNRMIERGQFPAPVRLSPNRVVWRRGDVDAWVASRPLARTAT